MNKFQRFLGRISAETCLKWIILVVNRKNRQILEDPPSDPLAPGPVEALLPDPH